MCIRGLGKYQQALSLLKKCLSAYKKSKDIEGEAYVLWALGTTHRFACQFAQAEKQLRLSVEKYSLLKDPSGLAYARAGLGGTLRMRGKPQESFHLYQKASQFFSQAKDHFGIAYSSCGQGNALRMMGFSDKALPYMNKAIRIYKALRLRGPLGFVLWSRSQAFLALKKRDQAQRDLQEARRQFLLVKDRRGLKYCVLGHRQLQKKPCKIIQIP
ncbi:MAG: hypothetical protein KCHDKBKB_01886 [Elusimicrobia bacterium]|nr:hypothetical protein [Elusimicrobiota bacterium]